MKYYVSYRLTAIFDTEVEADSPEEAKNKATYKFYEADFGDATDIDGERVHIEDENGNIIWEE